MDGARLAPLLGPGFATLTLALEQPLRLAQHEGAVFALVDIGGELRAIDPSASGRETRLGARYDYVADASGVAAFAEASYAAEPYHIDGAEPDGRVRVGVSAKF